MLRLEDVSLAVGGVTRLDQLNLVVGSGELVVVHGPRGAGKSLLLAIASARRPPDGGQVWISTRKVGDLQRSSLPLVHRSVAYLPPLAPLLDDESVLENVMLAPAVRGSDVDQCRLAALEALVLTGIEECADRPVAALSSGERRLCAVARALAGPPAGLVLDDPTAGMCPADRDRVLAGLAAVAGKGTAVLFATNDEMLAQATTARGGRRVRLEGGRLTGGLPGIALVPRLGAEPEPLERPEPRARSSP
jgi:ABC-type ATPase involved in cell division